ncbi:MAG: ribonuclease III [Pyrinomonadaceae bacterium]|nr:ribonuclease III [Pyrinomonadaceae bacterium]
MKKRKAGNTDLQELEEILAYEFEDRSLLERAVTHRSWAHEKVAQGSEEEARRLHNEALEFMGDSVLGMIVASHLFLSNPNTTEGELSRMKHRLVSAATLARLAEEMGLGEFLRLGVGEEKTGGRAKRALLADTFEAVLGAIFMDGGLQAATDFVIHMFGAELESASPEQAAADDYKTLLQERLQAERHVAPQYDVVKTEGPPHRRVFHVEVSWEGGSVRATGRTIKSAETQAARLALKKMGEGSQAEQAAD